MLGRIGLGIAVGAGIAIFCASCDRQVDTPLRHQTYVWQRAWTPAVTEAIERSASWMAGWHILLAETDESGDWREFSGHSAFVAPGLKPLTAVVRIDGRRGLSDASGLTKRIQTLIRKQPPGRWSGLEIDYDCPSRQLYVYAAFIRALKAALPRAVTVSVTALPTWIEAPGIDALLAAADESVLQVHSVLDPHQGLFDRRRAAGWIAAYSKLSDKPFRVALPNYGSRVAWSSTGRLLSVISEQDAVQLGPVQQELEARPQDVAALLSELSAAHAKNLVGILWFRLPVAQDRRIWSWRTWVAVIGAQALDARPVASARRDESGAYRIALENAGNLDMPLPRTIRVTPCVAADGVANYSIQHGSDRLAFNRRAQSTLRAGQRVEIGWTRCAPNQRDFRLED
jgi:hypothetical protein